MADSTQKKSDPAILANLHSGNEEKILNAVQELRNSGSSVYIPVLAELLLNTGFDEVRKSIISLLGDLKDKDSIPAIIGAIENQNLFAIRKELITACWKNGLDYSPYLSLWVTLVIENDMDIAFEAFTVIENLDILPDAAIREAEIIRINHALRQADEMKGYLLKELRGILA